MVTIKHKVTIKTKIAQEETPTAADTVVTAEQSPEQKSESTLSSETPEHKQESKKGKVIGGIAAVAVLLGGIYFFGIRNNGSDVNGDTTPEHVTQVENTAKSETLDETNANGESAAVNAGTEKPSEAENTPSATDGGKGSAPAKDDEDKADRHPANDTPAAQPTKPSLSKQATASPQGATATINGDVEENARRVIRGEFGNGQTRKDKLGTSYSEIQGRVNEMYRQGLVH